MREVASFDHILKTYVGGHGKYQIINAIYMTLLGFASLPINFYVFTAYAPPHRCHVSKCETHNGTKLSDDLYGSDWLSFALPQEESSSNYLGGKHDYDGCKMFKMDHNPKPLNSDSDSICMKENFNINVTEPCQEYIYDNTYFDETLSIKFDLVCDNEHYRSLLGTILILGLLVGSIIGGHLGDHFGRKKAIFGSIALTVPVIIGSGYVNDYNVYAVMHFIMMSCLPVMWVNGSVYSNEMFDPKWRILNIAFNLIPIISYAFGLIVYLNRTWTGIHVCCGVISAITLLVWFMVPESPRWLAQNGHENEAMEILLQMAKTNGKSLTSDDEAKMRKMVADLAIDSHATEDKLTILDMFKHGQAMKTLILCLAWIMTCISFYAIGLNSSDLAGNIIVNYMLSRTAGIADVIYVLLTANYIGRRYALSIAHLIIGVSCVSMAFIPKEYSNTILALYLISTVFAGASFSLVYLMTSELYPTNLRSQAVGFASTISRVFCLCAPFLGHIAKIWEPAPMVLIGVPILISGLCVLKLPETFNQELPQTLRAARKISTIAVPQTAPVDQEMKDVEN